MDEIDDEALLLGISSEARSCEGTDHLRNHRHGKKNVENKVMCCIFQSIKSEVGNCQAGSR